MYAKQKALNYPNAGHALAWEGRVEKVQMPLLWSPVRLQLREVLCSSAPRMHEEITLVKLRWYAQENADILGFFCSDLLCKIIKPTSADATCVLIVCTSLYENIMFFSYQKYNLWQPWCLVWPGLVKVIWVAPVQTVPKRSGPQTPAMATGILQDVGCISSRIPKRQKAYCKEMYYTECNKIHEEVSTIHKKWSHPTRIRAYHPSSSRTLQVTVPNPTRPKQTMKYYLTFGLLRGSIQCQRQKKSF